MRTFTVEELRALIAHDAGPCVSIYLPTHRAWHTEDEQRYRALLNQARGLLENGLNRQQALELLAPLQALDGHEFWSHQLDGLAAFCSAGGAAHYLLPVDFKELAVVADSFHIRPLLRFLQSNQRYFLLNLSQGRVSLMKGSATGLGPVDLSTLPRSLADTLGVERRKEVLSSHSSGPRGHSPIFHGQGKEESAREEDLLRFLRSVDKGLWGLLRDETAPLVVAAPQKILALYQGVSRYPHLLHEGVHGNFANAKLEELHERAWPVVQAHVAGRALEVAERWDKAVSRGRSADDIAVIARHAVQGRVRELLVERDAHLWGRLDRTTGALELHPVQKDLHDDDVIDDIAEAVLLRGGDVYAFERAQMPSGSPAAATLRW